ncbi:Zinc phosphodiesterase ELAC protein 1 [Perkinsus olseni]|uniref:Zinc phosphodiesterase ELAC protein 1 n=1 Tax=Perkinsus olseni TaxID=32597 RepID=A0A7J6LIY0_PEROL|nr:Zinc phosphodiesterase ELAC protein 1 [Perkinsus olseni]
MTANQSEDQSRRKECTLLCLCHEPYDLGVARAVREAAETTAEVGSSSVVIVNVADVESELPEGAPSPMLLLTSSMANWIGRSEHKDLLLKGIAVILHDVATLPELPSTIRDGSLRDRRRQTRCVLTIFGVCVDAAALRLRDILSQSGGPLPSKVASASLKHRLRDKLAISSSQSTLRVGRGLEKPIDVLIIVPTLIATSDKRQSASKETASHARDVANEIKQALLACLQPPLKGFSVEIFCTGQRLPKDNRDMCSLSSLHDSVGDMYHTSPVKCLLLHIAERKDKATAQEGPGAADLAERRAYLGNMISRAKCIIIIGVAPQWTEDPIACTLFGRPDLIILWSARLLPRDLDSQLNSRSTILPYLHPHGPTSAVRAIADCLPEPSSPGPDALHLIIAFETADLMSLTSVLDFQSMLRSSQEHLCISLCSLSTLPLSLSSTPQEEVIVVLVIPSGYSMPKELAGLLLSPTTSGKRHPEVVLCCAAFFGVQPDIWGDLARDLSVDQVNMLEKTPVVLLQVPGAVEAVLSRSSNAEALTAQLQSSNGVADAETTLLSCLANCCACISPDRLPSVADLLCTCRASVPWARAGSSIGACGTFDRDVRKVFMSAFVQHGGLEKLRDLSDEVATTGVLLCLAPFEDLWPSADMPEWSNLIRLRRELVTECRTARLRELALELDVRLCMVEQDPVGAANAARLVHRHTELYDLVERWLRTHGSVCSSGCGWRGNPLKIAHHESTVCPLRVVTCPLCSATGPYNTFYNAHVCPKATVSCNRVGCLWTGPRDSASKHMSDECALRQVACSVCCWSGSAWRLVDHSSRFHGPRRSVAIITSTAIHTGTLEHPTLDIMDLASEAVEAAPRPDAAATAVWSAGGTMAVITLSRDGKRIDVSGPAFRGVFPMPSALASQWFTCLAAWDTFICAGTSGSTLLLLQVANDSTIREVGSSSTGSSSLHILAMGRYYVVGRLLDGTIPIWRYNQERLFKINTMLPFEGKKTLSQMSPKLGGWLGGYTASKLRGLAVLAGRQSKTSGAPTRPHYQPHTLRILGDGHVIVSCKDRQLRIMDFTGRSLNTVEVESRILSVALCRVDDSRLVVTTGMDDGQVVAWGVEMSTGASRVLGYAYHEHPVRDLAIRGPKEADMKGRCLLVAGTSEGAIMVWEVEYPVQGEPGVCRLAASKILVDCGEGTQHQLMLSKIKLTKIDDIFVTHLHGDHCYGIFGLLHSCCMGERTEPITVYGPKGIKTMIETVFALSGGWNGYDLRIVELDPTQHSEFTTSSGDVRVHACPLKHRLPTLGYLRPHEQIFAEPDKPGPLNAALATRMGARGPQFRELKEGRDVTLNDGTLIRAVDVIGEKTKGRTVAVLQDTCDSSEALPYLNRPDLLIHECTYHDGIREKAIEFGHSTAAMAGEFARSCDAKVLALTHFSPRYNDPDPNDEESPSVQNLREEALANAGPTTVVLAAEDFMTLAGLEFTEVAYDQVARSAVS